MISNDVDRDRNNDLADRCCDVRNGLRKSFLGAKMKKERKGACFLFSETGTEGGWWAMQEDGFATEDRHWKYEGLQYLREGDDFTVYADNGGVLSMASFTETL